MKTVWSTRRVRIGEGKTATLKPHLGGKIMTDTERLLAIEEIKQVKARYFRCMYMKARDGFTAVFSPDTSVDYAPEAADSSDWKASADV
jgi:hypothetical protein